MIGMIISGHGHFATGILSALELISGKQETIYAVDFEEGMSADELGANLDQAMSSFDKATAVVLFTDLKGGTPFNQAFLRCQNNERLAVVAGTNLGMLLASSFVKQTTSLNEFLTNAQQQGTVAIDYCTALSSQELDAEDE
ncbi:PTS galactosamine/N-acetylgalactosamine transporter subunit IIA [Enterococcus sp. DIV0086]|uniref:PTS sugar transporter subunit IIA domain-containing protein n=1 Tax=Enterococcus sp. DIV0086 TaxID=2774655 RepID=UPI003D2BFD22